MKLFKILITILIISLFTIGCSGGDKEKDASKKDSKNNSEQNKEDPPEQLEGIEESINKIFKTLKGPTYTEEKDEEGDMELKSQSESENKKNDSSKEEKGKESTGESGSGSGNSEENSPGAGGSEEKSSGGSEEKQDTEKSQESKSKQPAGGDKAATDEKAAWESLSKIVNTLHYDSNELVPKIAKSGANKNLLDSFSNSLNYLTDKVIEKDKIYTLFAANDVYKYLPDMYLMYKTDSSPEIKRIKYYTVNSVLNSYVADWEKAQTDMTNLKSSWDIYKNTVTEEKLEIASKLDFSIKQLEDAIKDKNQPITDIKGRVVLSNIAQIEKSK